MTYDALIIGAGPGGATAGLLLARAGWSVAIVERAHFPRRKVCGEFISATSLPLLHHIGVGRAFVERAGPEVRRVGLFAQDTVASTAMPETTGLPEKWGRALGREHLDVLVVDAALEAGAKLWQPWSVTDIQRRSDGFACKIAAKEGEKELLARVVIAANGSWERSSWAVSDTRVHRPSDLLAFKAHFQACALPADLMPLLMFPGGYGGMVNSDDGRTTLSCCIRRDELQRRRQQQPGHSAGEAVLEHIRGTCLGVREALQNARLEGAWLSAGPIRPGIRERFANGIFMVGNAAGEAHPVVAEGISMAMQSAWVLHRHLVNNQSDILAGRGVAEISKAYADEWAASFARRIRAAAVFAHLSMRPHVVSAMLPTLKRFPGILNLCARLAGKSTSLTSIHALTTLSHERAGVRPS
jgi:menaquinone-9 beta-reductase